MEYNNFATLTAAMTVKSGCCKVISAGPLPRRIASINVRPLDVDESFRPKRFTDTNKLTSDFRTAGTNGRVAPEAAAQVLVLSVLEMAAADPKQPVGNIAAIGRNW
jgi:hypothetical protein